MIKYLELKKSLTKNKTITATQDGPKHLVTILTRAKFEQLLAKEITKVIKHRKALI